ncbi:o-succinylbenzoate synthase [Planctomycetota bacterium]
MQIDSIEIFHVALPLCRPLATPNGPSDTLQTVLVRIDSGEAAGWGEASPGGAPVAGPEWAGGVFGCLRDWLAPAVVGRSVDSGKSLQELLAGFRGNQFAKAALDTAWWDLQARLAGKPLHEMLGGQREAVEVGVGFDQMDSIDEFFAAIAAAFEAGYARVELKMRPGWDINMLNAVRHEFPAQDIHADVEGALRLDQMDILHRLDDFMLTMVEQPLSADDLVGHAMVQETIRTPICLDESITTPQQAEMAIELKSGQYVNVKPGRVGGLTHALEIHDACRDGSIPCWVGAMPQSAIAARAGIALATKENFRYPADFFPTGEPLQQDLAEPPLPVRDGAEGPLRVPLWSEPGIGVEPDGKLLEEFSLARAKV